MKKWIYPVTLIFLFFILIAAIVPEGAVFGSHTDWLSQHAALAETIRGACLEQHSLLPSWISLGGGSNGYQFAYYGFLRPDILIGCLLPQVPMVNILICYMLTVYLASVLLCYVWLRSEEMLPVPAFTGSVLFMTAGCLFHMHRQVMFVNYLPFLFLALLCVRKKRFRWLPLCMCLICLSSFYFAISAFAAVGWYWFRREGKDFWKHSFLKKYVPCALTAAGLSAALLIPTALVLLEHGRGGSGLTFLSLLELFAPNPALNNLLFNEYGMGLTFVCLYAILAGLAQKKFRMDSLLFLLFRLFGAFSWLLNGTLYARPKILIPFMPLVILHCVRYLRDAGVLAPASAAGSPAAGTAGGTSFAAAGGSKISGAGNLSGITLPLFPFAVIFPVGLLWFSQEQFPWIMAEAVLLFALVLIYRKRTRPWPSRRPHRPDEYQGIAAAAVSSAGRSALVLLLLASPVGMALTTAGTEDWVGRSDIASGLPSEELETIKMDPLYHFDSLLSPLISSNALPKTGMTRSTMYSSVTGQAYADLYYDTLLTPIRINNRVALLTSDNPFMLHLLGVRYLDTAADAVPAGYEVICQSGGSVIAENKNVLPSVYFTKDIVTQEMFEQMEPLDKLDVITRKTVADLPDEDASHGTAGMEASDFGQYMKQYTPEFSSPTLPDGVEIRRSEDTWEITAEKTCTIDLNITNPQPGSILLLGFQLKNQSMDAVVIDINGIRNKLSGRFAPYPNRNNHFNYQFSPGSDEGITDLSITLSKGHYMISDVQWHLYDQSLLTAKDYTPLTLSSGTPGASGTGSSGRFHTVLSGTVTADQEGCLATSIPAQNGLEILVDGQPSEIITVNEAFAGTVLTEGTHEIEIRFSPPGKTAGILISILAAAGYVIFLAAYQIKLHRKRLEGRDRK